MEADIVDMRTWIGIVLAAVAMGAGRVSTPPRASASRPALAPMKSEGFNTKPGQPLQRLGDEIMVCGQLFHTSTRVILWTDPGGYDAYRVERRFAKFEESSWESTLLFSPDWREKSPNRYNIREAILSPTEIEKVRGGGWDLALLKDRVDQFVLHYDACGVSKLCFQVLQDDRGLSVHFLLDIDGTIYQTLDLKERAWHATICNSRSIGIEIANVGAVGVNDPDNFKPWYGKDAGGKTRITIPSKLGDGGVMTPNFVGRPARENVITGTIGDAKRRQMDFTPEQYQALAKLTATLCTVFPKIKCDYPRDGEGKLVNHKLELNELEAYEGIMGHYHIQADKIDPGPAFQWDLLINTARGMMEE